MSRIEKTFKKLQQQKRAALVPYFTAGDPSIAATPQIMHDLVSAGADMIELGMAFSDPVADGPVIQAAHHRALVNGCTLNDIFKNVTEFRHKDDETPIVLMSYLNPIEIMGYDEFIHQVCHVGIDGVLIVDMPPEEGGALTTGMKAKGIDAIFLIAPTTQEERIKTIAKASQGYLYYVSLKGVTGAGTLDTTAVGESVKQIKQHTKLPIAVGFGIHDGESAAKVAEFADAVIVGSALVALIEKHGDDLQKLTLSIKEFIGDLRKSIDTGQAVSSRANIDI